MQNNKAKSRRLRNRMCKDDLYSIDTPWIFHGYFMVVILKHFIHVISFELSKRESYVLLGAIVFFKCLACLIFLFRTSAIGN